MGAEPIQVQVQVSCDGPNCSEVGTSTNIVDPVPDGWITYWGPPERLGKFYFHIGSCYDAWTLETQNIQASLKKEEGADS